MITDRYVTAMAQSSFREYPKLPPFLPSTRYAELRDTVQLGREDNPVYPLMRALFCSHGLDRANFATPEWNPLGELIAPGQTVLIKPNLVRHKHMTGGDYRTVVTHGSVIRCVLDYVGLALRGKGTIVVGDAPVQSADFDAIVARNFLREVCDDVQSAWQVPVQLMDFRLCQTTMNDDHAITGRKILSPQTGSYRPVDLKQESLLAPLNGCNQLFRVTNYDCSELVSHHNEERHEYLIPSQILDADVVISIPKLKTHRKVGMTAALKNLVGINGHKDWLPHHRRGSLAQGGDEYQHSSLLKQCITGLTELDDRSPGQGAWGPVGAVVSRVLRRVSKHTSKDHYEEGSWYGNDTIWRTVLDLNRVLIYADRQGRIQDQVQRRYFTIVDAVIAGQGEGPMEPDPVNCGMLVCGGSSLAVDFALACLIGFDYQKIPLIRNGFDIAALPLVNFSAPEVRLRRHLLDDTGEISEAAGLGFNFAPPAGWKGHIEA